MQKVIVGDHGGNAVKCPGWRHRFQSRRFIGLFGTVWMMDASPAGAVGRELAAVAPHDGSADPTAAGHFTAIPAVIAYNHFLHNIKIWVAAWMALRSSRRDDRKTNPGQRM